MSAASFVPETHDLEAGDARGTLRRSGWILLVKATVTRFTAADGLSHVRALAFSLILALFPAIIAVVGLATAFHLTTFRVVLATALNGLSPGTSGDVLSQAALQAPSRAGAAALVLGGVSSLVAGASAMAQLERGANRIYGVERDRPGVQRYVRGLVLYLSAGLPLVAGFVLVAAGGAIGNGIDSVVETGSLVSSVWAVLRWPVGIGLVAWAITLIIKRAPNRHQPSWSWLAMGTTVAVVLWVTFTAGLAAYYATDASAGSFYGSLLGVVALLLWSYLSSLALHLGVAFAAQVEATRAGAASPMRGPNALVVAGPPARHEP